MCSYLHGQTQAAFYLEPTERFSFPEQTFDPFGRERERYVGVSESVLVLPHPFVTQGTVSKQPEAKTPNATLSESPSDAKKNTTGSASYLNCFGLYLMASVKYLTAVSYWPEAAKRYPIPERERNFAHFKTVTYSASH